MAFSFQLKRVLVTGAGRGLGRQIAVRLAESGADVYAVSRTSAMLETLKAQYPSITTITLDLSDWKHTREVLKQLEPMDGLVNNAADIQMTAFSAMETDASTMNKYLQNNLYSVVNCTQVIAGKMILSGKRGSIVNTSSTVSLAAVRGVLAYSISKAGLDMVTKQFALELGSYNIRVNSVNPTLFLTDKVKKIVEAADCPTVDEILSTTPMKRLPEVDEVVGPVLYLLSDLSSMVNGTIQVIDGGKLSTF